LEEWDAPPLSEVNIAVEYKIGLKQIHSMSCDSSPKTKAELINFMKIQNHGIVED